MRFNSKVQQPMMVRMGLIALLLGALNGCVALDEYINPYYDDTGEDSAAQQDDSPKDVSANDSAEDVDKSRSASGVPGEEVAAPSLLATIGPNPFLASNLNPNAAAQAQYQQALSAMQAEDWSGAERLLDELVQSNPLLSGPLLNLGIAQANQDKDDLAQLSFENAIKVNRSNQEAYNQLGLLHRKHGRFQEAKNSYLSAISVWPGYAPIRLNLGILFELYIGDLAQALNQYQAYQSLQVEPDRKINGWIKDLQRRLQVTRS